MSESEPTGAEFDRYAADYDAALQQGLAVSGEGQSYFAERRITWLAGKLRKHGYAVRTVLDYGCGTGASTPLLLQLLNAEEAVGTDISERSLEIARTRYASERVRFAGTDELTSCFPVDLVYCNGVFHHILPADRDAAIQSVVRALRPGGLFALWENNPLNPGTRYVMRRIPFDRDAVTLRAGAAANLVLNGGLEVIGIDFLFIFPRPFALLRFLEPWLTRLPIGAQYQILCRKRVHPDFHDKL